MSNTTEKALWKRTQSAESALKSAREVLTMYIESGAILDKIDAHVDKYLKPKGPLDRAIEKISGYLESWSFADTKSSLSKSSLLIRENVIRDIIQSEFSNEPNLNNGAE